MSAFLKMWESQVFIMTLWSLLCFGLGASFTVTLYWYRVNYVVKRAEKELDLLMCPNNRRWRCRRFTDIYALPAPPYHGEERRKQP